MNINTVKYFCTSNGNGLTTSIFVSGCRLHCNGCFNQKVWNFNSGTEMSDEIIDEILIKSEPEYISGFSILGGEPLDENNMEGVSYLINRIRKHFGTDKAIWIWSGYQLEEMSDGQKKIALKCDYLIDGPFNKSLSDLKLKYRGSSNQNIWKICNGKFILKEEV